MPTARREPPNGDPLGDDDGYVRYGPEDVTLYAHSEKVILSHVMAMDLCISLLTRGYQLLGPDGLPQPDTGIHDDTDD